ncbi:MULTISPECIES: NAD(P)/FAD-dependent oxidoreductase [unclassified Exiguobacterium]|uniref:NAD(P)/FAD-dependent oxidoreductase n=1 Tax=unclassified Exiguobacterium TaxID=2644629 RepID=UPI0025C33D21|nr:MULTISPECIES: FAD-dependent oxidoreductase [unclassified Exiguobacterium]
MKRILLIGAGHAHLHCITHGPTQDVEWLVLNASTYQYYSGMYSGLADGTYDMDEMRIDVAALCRAYDKPFIKETVIKVDPVEKVVFGASGRRYTYDVVSTNIGSFDWPEDMARLSIKPNYRLPDTLKRLQLAKRPVVIGSGAAAVEMAASLKAAGVPITLITDPELLSGHPAAEAITRRLQELDVYWIRERPLNEASPLLFSHHPPIESDALIRLTGAKAPALFADSKLYTEDGFLLVNEQLQALDHPSLFAAGDAATLVAYPDIPKNGVTAVRQAPVLLANLLHYVQEEALQTYRPQTNYLTILSMGPRHSVSLYGKSYSTNRLGWYLKRWIDQRFMRKYRP